MKCIFFEIYELVPPDLYEQYKGREYVLWWLFDAQGLYTIDMLRRKYGAFVINDYGWGGDFTDSGLRIPGSEYYSLTSQHSYAKGFDLKPGEGNNYTVEKIRQDIIDRKYSFMWAITGLELDVPWLHIDFRNLINGQDLHTFKP